MQRYGLTYENGQYKEVACDDGIYVLYTEALAEKEAAVHEWQDIAGQWEDKCQKLTEQIAIIEEEHARLVKEKETTIQEGCQIIFEGIKVVEGLEQQIAAMTAENERLNEALIDIWSIGDDKPPYNMPELAAILKIAQDALRQGKGGRR